MIYQTLLLESKKGYAVVTLHRPKEMNAISRQMGEDLYVCFTALEEDSEIRAIVLTGGDYVFSSGMDLKELSVLPETEIGPLYRGMARYLKRIYSCRKPVVGAVGGIALGGGFNLAACCDLLVASESAIFGHPEVAFGINPLFTPLQQIVGMAKAKELTMLGQPIGAKEALHIGLVNKVATPERLMIEADALARELADKSPEAIGAVKRVCGIAPYLDRISVLEMEIDIEAFLYAGEERKKRMAEFLKSLRERKKG